MPSFYLPLLTENTHTAVIEGEEFHHLSRVKRAAIGDVILLNSGKGHLARGQISSLDKHKAVVAIQEYTFHPAPSPAFAIAFALLKNHHDELLVEKCTELGAQRFFPLDTRYSVRNPGKNTVTRFAKVALAAIKQCDNPWLPVVEQSAPLETALQSCLQQGFTPIVCSERQPGKWLPEGISGSETHPCFFIGPEGGWAEEELRLFENQGVPEISISNLVLRAETAAITIAAQWNLLNR